MSKETKEPEITILLTPKQMEELVEEILHQTDRTLEGLEAAKQITHDDLMWPHGRWARKPD